jgi:hypothetical protein
MPLNLDSLKPEGRVNKICTQLAAMQSGEIGCLAAGDLFKPYGHETLQLDPVLFQPPGNGIHIGGDTRNNDNAAAA